MKKFLTILLTLIFFTSFIYAENTEENIKEKNTTTIRQNSENKDNSVWFFTLVCAGCVVGLGLAAFGCGLGMGSAINGSVEGISRQPEAHDKIQTLLLIGLAFIESLIIYVLVISLILLFANPFVGKF
jgi:F-type H+-transporting ATPase subunit c